MLERGYIIKMLTETKLAGDLDADSFEQLIRYMRALREHGECNWYGWACENWGTKWAAYSQDEVDARTIKFDTAWSMPEPVIRALSEMFPDNEFRLRWADEDFGCNTGDATFQDGHEVEGCAFENCSPEAYKNAAAIQYPDGLPDYYRWKDDGTCEYVDEDEEDEDE
jgi:hypothetical protein